MADTATLGAFSDDGEAQAAYTAAKRRLLWRRRLLPIATFLILLVLWEVGVRVFDVKPFIAPAPSAVFTVLANKFPMLMQNLLPTAIEAISGFMLGNLAAISIARIAVFILPSVRGYPSSRPIFSRTRRARLRSSPSRAGSMVAMSS